MSGANPPKRRALGRGLDALLPKGLRQKALLEIEVDQIRPNPLQPRIRFEARKLEELAASVKENGMLQPLVVRKVGEGFEIIAGERRWRAALKADLARVPAIVQDVSEQELLQLALVENLQRDDLGAIEEARAYQLLRDHFHLTQEEIARRVGRSRAAVANTLRLLQLPDLIQGMVTNGELSMGHARALLPLPRGRQVKLARQIVAEGWSVRQAEEAAQEPAASDTSPPRRRMRQLDPNLRAAQQRLEQRWRTRVLIRPRQSGGGRIVLECASDEELQRLFDDLLA